MPRSAILDPITSLLTSGPITSAKAQARLAEARAALTSANEAYGRALFSSASGDGAADVPSARAKVWNTEREVREAEVLINVVAAHEAEQLSQHQAELRAHQDEQVLSALAVRSKTAEKLTKAIASYADLYRAFQRDDDAFRAHAASNPRVRQDILLSSTMHRVSQELTRVSAGLTPPPGAALMAGILGNPAELQAFTDTIEADAAAIRSGFDHA